MGKSPAPFTASARPGRAARSEQAADTETTARMDARCMVHLTRKTAQPSTALPGQRATRPPTISAPEERDERETPPALDRRLRRRGRGAPRGGPGRPRGAGAPG